ncbi:MAG: hypothetical protein Q4C40_01195 [Eubacteriales bacterium]|nr:hypothetical protein [Eubacteriales bacterium]
MSRKNVKWIAVMVIIFILLVIAVASFVSGKSASIRRFVNSNSVELTQYAQNMIKTGSNGECETYGDYEVTYWADTGMVEFVLRKHGMGSASVYEGFYYSPNDTPLGFQGNQVDFTISDSGWTWEESNGDNWEYTEKILEHWYWFEFHF